MATDDIVVRQLESVDDFRKAEDVQRVAWDMEGDTAMVPAHILITAQKNGGLVLGAFEEDMMVGYLFGFLGQTAEGDVKHCSHMVGVVPRYRSRGIAQALKRRQRQFVLDQGLDLITWTYDPLEGASAHLNIAKLGGICRTYIRDLYGEIKASIYADLPTDRFEVEWWVRSSRVAAHCSENPPAPAATLDDVLSQGAAIVNQVELDSDGLPATLSWEPHRRSTVLVEIPPNFQEIKEANTKLARDWRLLTRALFEEYFEDGYVIVDFISEVRDGQRRSFYVMVREPALLDSSQPAQLSAEDRAAVETGMALYNSGQYWDCHEALEEVWLDAPPEHKPFLQGLIQAAAAFHKYLVQHNAVGAVKLLTRSLNKLTRYSDDYMGLAMAPFKHGLSACWREIIDLGQQHIDEFDEELVPPMKWIDEATC
ncbi:MAG: hypothetical protein MAG451_01719 [Anaerolineales bacterium]|nr:hypothetical protein [Anaerolineales bacterium]